MLRHSRVWFSGCSEDPLGGTHKRASLLSRIGGNCDSVWAPPPEARQRSQWKIDPFGGLRWEVGDAGFAMRLGLFCTLIEECGGTFGLVFGPNLQRVLATLSSQTCTLTKPGEL